MDTLAPIRELVSGDGYNAGATTESFKTLRSNNALAIQREFFPLTPYNSEKEIAAYIAFSNGGKMQRYIGKPREIVGINGGYKINQGMMTWEEQYVLSREDLEYLSDPSNTNIEIPFSMKVAMGQDLLANRLNNNLEYMSFDVIMTGSTESINFPVSNHLRLDLNDTAQTGYADVRDLPTSYKWTPGGLWTDETASNPLQDIRNMVRWLEKSTGNKVSKIYCAPDVINYMTLNNDIWDRFSKTDALAGGVRDITMLSNLISWMPAIEEYSGSYVAATTTVATAASSSATSLVVDSYTGIADGDLLMITEKSTGKVITTEVTASVSSTTLTVDALTDALSVGSVVEVRKNFMPQGHMIFKLDGGPMMQKMATVKTIMNGGITNPQPGPYSIVDVSQYDSDPWVKVVAGAKAAPVVFRSGGFAAARVTDGTNFYI